MAQPTARLLGAQIVPVLDARRDEVYAARYDAGMAERSAGEVLKLTPGSFAAARAAGPILFVGNGAAKTMDALGDPAGCHALPGQACDARGIVRRGAVRLAAGETANVLTSTPIYLKPVYATTPRDRLRPSS
jgi:tRNA threonylcarbamoyladenosine biosynthesis protein TsaB